MKRLATAFSFLLLLLAPTFAQAGLVRATKPLVFAKYRATTAAPGRMQPDSAYVAHTGAVADTTAPFTLDDWGIANLDVETAGDSISLFDVGISYTDGATLTAAGNSSPITSIKILGSLDGTNWVPGVITQLAETENGAGLTAFKGYTSIFPGTITVAATTNAQLGVFPIYRIIISAHASTKGVIHAWVSYWRSVPDDKIIRAEELVGWRHLQAAAANDGIVDSTFLSHTGAITDTTAPFYTPNLAFVHLNRGADSVAVDSVAAFTTEWTIESGATSTAAGDTLYTTLQSSWDGVNWTSGGWSTTANTDLLEIGNGAGLGFFKAYNATRTGTVTVAAATILETALWPIHRYIVQTSAGTTGIIKCKVRWWTRDT